MMAGNQKFPNLLSVFETKLKDLETQLELARARSETIEAQVETIKAQMETIKALMKIDEAREKEALEKEVHEKKPVPTYNPKIEILESLESNEAVQVELPSYDADDTFAPWKDSYLTDTLVKGNLTNYSTII
jgi:chromosome segregation ATPase